MISIEPERIGRDPAATDTVGLPRGLRYLRDTLAAAFTLISVAWSLDLFRALDLVLYTEQFLAVMLGLAIALVFVVYPAHRHQPRDHIPWFDAVAIIVGLAAATYTAIKYPEMANRLVLRPTDAYVVAVLLALLSIEGLRRAVGWTLFFVVVSFLAYALLGHYGPAIIRTRQIDIDRLFIYLTLDASALFGPALTIGATIVVAFVLFGQFLLKSHGSDFFNDIAMALMGRFRGGAAKIAVAGSSLFGTITGISSSNILATGVVTIPLMKRAGYPAHQAAAVEAVASNGGSLIPPVMGTVAFLMADILAIPYRDVALAALIPGLLYYVALFILTDLDAARGGYGRVSAELIPRAALILKLGWFYAIPFAVLVWALFWLNAQPERAALYATGTVLLLGFIFGYRGKRLRVADLWAACITTGIGVVGVMMILAGAGFIMGVLNLSGLGFALTLSLVEVGSAHILLLLVLAASICIVLGMGMPPVGVYVLLAVMIVPSLVEVGVEPLAAHMFIFYMGNMSMVTPPVAIGAFFAANLAGAPPIRTAFSAMRLGWTAYIVPFLFVFSPSLLLEGDSVWSTILAVATAIAGVWLISIGFVGYLWHQLSILRRALFLTSGFLLLVPAGVAPWGWYTDLTGLVLGTAVLAIEFLSRQQSVPQTSR